MKLFFIPVLFFTYVVSAQKLKKADRELLNNLKAHVGFLADDKLEVIETPGHSPGSICFYCREQGFVISGDVLFESSIGRTDLPGGDYQTLLNSIKQKLFVLPDEVIVYNGHGEQTTIGREKKYNPFVGEMFV